MKQPIDLEQAAMDRELQRVFTAQRANRWNVAGTTARQRVEKLQRLREAILSRRSRIAEALHADFRKSPAEVELTELHPTLGELQHAVKHLGRWMRPRKVSTPLTLSGARSFVRYEPRGQVLILAPWNYPVQLMLSPLVAAVAAGNCAILKPSEKTPHTSGLIKELVASVFPENEVATFEGDARAAEALLELPFDHIFFTGSTRVGHKVMAAAARHLASVTLELGGKSPAIVDPTADLDETAARIAFGKCLNSGQTCVAPDYVLVHESRARELIEKLKARLAALYGDTEEARERSADFCRLIDAGAFERVKGLVTRSVEKGAKVEIGGRYDPATRYVAPTVLSNVTPDSPIMQEEIFGPVLPVMTWSSREDVYRYLDGGEKPLALYIFSRDRTAIEELLRRTTAGGTCVNQAIVHLVNHELPFGGVGPSGLGSYHGEFGFRAFSHERAVLIQASRGLAHLVYPPYGRKLTQRMIQFVGWLSGA